MNCETPDMPADPLDPGAMPLAEVRLTSAQVKALIAAVETHPGSVRIEQLSDGYTRAVLIGPDGDAVSEQTLFPV
jgi:hypothetical protein